MYCVKCGVKLQDSMNRCPLCGTPVWLPEEVRAEENDKYSKLLPESTWSERIPAVAFITVVCAAVCLSFLIFCLKTYDDVAWSPYVMLGIALFYVVMLLPLWFKRQLPLLFVTIDYACACAYLLYICAETGGSWFLSFAFPVVGICCILTIIPIALYKYVKKRKLLITGSLLLLIGGSTMLIELFQHITFGSEMFTWSLYSVTAFSIFGLFLVVAEFIRPLREYLKRKLFF